MELDPEAKKQEAAEKAVQEAVEVEQRAAPDGQSETQLENATDNKSFENYEAECEQRLNELPSRPNELTMEQATIVEEMFRNANCASDAEKSFITNFISGEKFNPCPSLGNIASIKLSEHIERTLMDDGTQGYVVAETHFQMNYLTGEWEHLKVYGYAEKGDPLAKVTGGALHMEDLFMADEDIVF